MNGTSSSQEDAWLLLNTFLCERLSVRMHPRQCEVNKRDQHPSCINCDCDQNPYLKVGDKTPAKRKWQRAERPIRVETPGITPGMAHIVSGDIEMANKCKVDDCEKQAQNGKDGMCCACWRKATGEPPKRRGHTDAAPLASFGTKGKLLAVAGDENHRHGFFLDFAGHEGLLERLNNESDNPAGDIINILALLDSGEVQLRKSCRAPHPHAAKAGLQPRSEG